MIRTLFIIALAGLVLATASLGGAFALGGRDLVRNGGAWTFRDADGDTLSFKRYDERRLDDATRTLAWTGGQSLAIDLAADVDYVQGATPGVVITGPTGLIDKVRLENGRLTWTETDQGPEHETVFYGSRTDGRPVWLHTDLVRIVVTAPDINRFDLEGDADLTLKAYDQDTLAIDISGAGEVEAEGRTRALELDISGSGDADLSGLTTTDANVAIAGSGDARVAPTGRAALSISGSGDIDVTTRPTTVSQAVSGSGDIDID